MYIGILLEFSYWYYQLGQDEVAQQVHTLSNLPGPTSSIVRQEKDKSVVNVETLANNFRQLGGLGGIAYYGAFAYGDGSLQDKTTTVYKDLQALHEKYTTTFGDFESTSSDVTRQLQTAFDQLRQGKQEASIDTLKQVSGATTRLKASASTLYQTTTASGTKVTLQKLRCKFTTNSGVFPRHHIAPKIWWSIITFNGVLHFPPFNG